MVGSVGRVIGPPTLSSLLAWSLESTGGVDYHLVFVLEAIFMLVIVLLGLRSFTLASLTIPIEHRHASYEHFPLVDNTGRASSDGIAGEAITPRLEGGRRRVLH